MHKNLAVEGAGQDTFEKKFKKIPFILKKLIGRPFKSAPTHHPLTPSQASRNAVEKWKIEGGSVGSLLAAASLRKMPEQKSALQNY